MPEYYAIITAGGSGQRMGSDVPKQFMELAGLPVIMHSMQAFYNFSPEINIIVVIPQAHMSAWNSMTLKYKLKIKHSIVFGGETRFHSVQNGLGLVPFDSFVAVHDAARPLLRDDLIERCFETAFLKGNAVPTISVSDSMREILKEENRAVDRSKFCRVQTPQVFNGNILKQAYEQDYKPLFTDDASVVESAGHKIHLVDGEQRNIKITTAVDMVVAETLLNA
jgi:2-C-methyl-D-erythritol 4-phosphate cytidylyltransferase